MDHKIGDRVKLTFEGEISYASGDYHEVRSASGTRRGFCLTDEGVSVERIKPAYEIDKYYRSPAGYLARRAVNGWEYVESGIFYEDRTYDGTFVKLEVR